MKYFLHDTSSFDDEKITLLYLEFGYEGLGLFYTALEKIGKQEKPINTIALKAQLKVGKRLEKCWKFMEQIELIHSNNGETFNEQLLNYSEKYQIKKEKNKEKVSEWRDKQKDIKDVTSNEPVRNPCKVKESKIKKSKEEIKEFDFFWNAYHKYTNKVKTDKEACIKYWNKLTEEERKRAITMIPAYAETSDDSQYLKKARTYLADKNFNDELDKKTEGEFNDYLGKLELLHNQHIEDGNN